MNTPIVVIHTGVMATIDNFYAQIRHSINQRFHSYELQCPVYPESEEDAGNRVVYTAYAEHASDGLYQNSAGNYYYNGEQVDIERLIV